MKTTAAALLILLAAAGAGAEEGEEPDPPLDETPGGDIVRGLPVRPAARPVSILPMETTAYGRAADGCFCVPPERDAGALPLVESQDLGAAVQALMGGVDLPPCDVQGETFQVPGDRAAGVREALRRLRSQRP